MKTMMLPNNNAEQKLLVPVKRAAVNIRVILRSGRFQSWKRRKLLRLQQSEFKDSMLLFLSEMVRYLSCLIKPIKASKRTSSDGPQFQRLNSVTSFSRSTETAENKTSELEQRKLIRAPPRLVSMETRALHTSCLHSICWNSD